MNGQCPERRVIDVIDQLVDEQLRQTPDDYEAPYSEVCELCGYEWHGVANGLGCPGAFATEQQLDAWRAWCEKVGDAKQLAELGQPFQDVGFVGRGETCALERGETCQIFPDEIVDLSRGVHVPVYYTFDEANAVYQALFVHDTLES